MLDYILLFSVKNCKYVAFIDGYRNVGYITNLNIGKET